LNYEKEGILNPKKKDSKSRYYSLDDLEKARLARILIKSKTMKLAGVKILLSVFGKTDTNPEDYSDYIQNILKTAK
jgi:DNA-binding transcriptional MerR regulator